MLPIIQVIIFAASVFLLASGATVPVRTGVVMLALIVPSAFISFTGLIYTERNVLFWLACMLVFVKRYEQAPAVWSAVAAVLCAHAMVYYKEPAFVFVLVFSMARMMLSSFGDDGRPHAAILFGNSANRLYMWLAVVALVFLLYYLAVMLPHWNDRYATNMAQPLRQIVKLYASASILPWLLAATVAARARLVALQELRPEPFWDALAIGGVAYFATLLSLRIYATYFTAPTDLIAILYFTALGANAWPLLSRSKRAAFIAVATVTVAQCLTVSIVRAYETYNISAARADVARAVALAHRDGGARSGRLYFPFSGEYAAGQFAAYLQYAQATLSQRVRIEITSLIMAGPRLRSGGNCEAFQEAAVCMYDSAPRDGDLAILLPDDVASMNDIAAVKEMGSVLFEYTPSPGMPAWATVYLRGLVSFPVKATVRN